MTRTASKPAADCALLQEDLLNQLAAAAALCRKVEGQLAHNPPPSLDTLLKVHHLLVLKVQAEAEAASETNPKLLKLAADLIKKPAAALLKSCSVLKLKLNQ